MFGLSVPLAMSYVLSVACTLFCVIYGLIKTIKREK
jgi:hypothetical protein